MKINKIYIEILILLSIYKINFVISGIINTDVINFEKCSDIESSECINWFDSTFESSTTDEKTYFIHRVYEQKSDYYNDENGLEHKPIWDYMAYDGNNIETLNNNYYNNIYFPDGYSKLLTKKYNYDENTLAISFSVDVL